jgi:hypothetical protein
MKFSLNLTQIGDRYVRDAFEGIQKFIRANMQPSSFKHFEIEFEGAVTNFTYPHGLGVIPTDVIQTSKTGAGAVTWNYELFDRENLNITTTGACTVRAYIGSHQEITT